VQNRGEKLQRRTFIQASGAASLVASPDEQAIPEYEIVSSFRPVSQPGMPGQYPGQVVAVHADKCIDPETEKVDAPTVKEMISRGMRALTGDKTDAGAWRRFFTASDVVGIKANCSGAPGAMSMPDVIAEIARNLIAIGIKPEQIYVWERSQLPRAGYEKYVPAGVQLHTAGRTAYDPKTYVECNFFGEENTRSNMVALITQKLTKIINVPNMKDHGAAGVTGCLKNIAYGSFDNVARSHHGVKTHTLSFIGTLASVEPVRSRTVLNIMDGLRGVWHGGPFSRSRKFRFYPKQMMFGTDPVAMDRLLLDIIDDKRRAEGAVSVRHHDMKYVQPGPFYADDPNIDRFLREPGHIEYAARKFRLGVYDITKIKVKRIEIA
jgi:uncharacterized protein (DUF362 family)